jgi:hypothetical protein
MNEEQRKNAVEQLNRQLKNNPNDKAVLSALAKLDVALVEKVKSAKNKNALQNLTSIDLDLRKTLKDLKVIVLESL